MADQRLRFIAEWVDRGLKRGAEEAKRAAKGISENWDDAKKTIGTVTAAAAAAGLALKQAYDVAKQGAAIELASQRFDRLSASIGTTGDALRDDLADATDGLMSDAEQMQLAGELMSLGLVKTHDEAVRLTSVASQLGMNMNQLVLTLTNRTTMRFDALGVAVDGFDEKVQALEESGLSVEEAFTEAFLQQAEDQIERVGSVADTAAGDFMKFEAAVTNLSDAMKQKLARNTSDAFEAMALLITWGDRVNDMAEEADERITRTSRSYEEYTDRIQKANGAIVSVRNEIQMMSEAEWEQAHALQASIEYEERREQLVRDGIGTIEEAADANWNYADAMEAVNTNLDSTISKWKDQITALENGIPLIEELANDVLEDLDNNAISASEAMDRLTRYEIQAAVAMGDFAGMDFERIRDKLVDMGLPLKDAVLWAAGIVAQMQNIDGMQATIDLFINQHGSIPKGIGDGQVNVDTFVSQQAGGDFVVPPSFVGDSFPVRATAGERVKVTTASQTGHEILVQRNRDRRNNIELANLIVDGLAGALV